MNVFRRSGWVVLLVGLAAFGCGGPPPVPRSAGASGENLEGLESRMAMIDTLRVKGIEDEAVIEAMSRVRRHAFIPDAFAGDCDPYGDHPCPIGHGQTISQPYVVAYVTAALNLVPGERVLEIGTGSGYQAAVLASMGARVYSIEIVPELAEHARQVLPAEGFTNVALLEGDGYLGWPENAPYDVIIVTCAPEDIPDALVAQLKDGGRMILPVGAKEQRLVKLIRRGDQVERVDDLPVRFVPMVHDD